MHCDYMTDGEQKLLLFKEPAPENEIVCYTVDSAITNAKVRGPVPSVEKNRGGPAPRFRRHCCCCHRVGNARVRRDIRRCECTVPCRCARWWSGGARRTARRTTAARASCAADPACDCAGGRRRGRRPPGWRAAWRRTGGIVAAARPPPPTRSGRNSPSSGRRRLRRRRVHCAALKRHRQTNWDETRNARQSAARGRTAGVRAAQMLSLSSSLPHCDAHPVYEDSHAYKIQCVSLGPEPPDYCGIPLAVFMQRIAAHIQCERT